MTGRPRQPRKRLNPPPPIPTPASAVAEARALEELTELHSPAWADDPKLCRECLLPYPCKSRKLAGIIAGDTPTTEETAPDA